MVNLHLINKLIIKRLLAVRGFGQSYLMKVSMLTFVK
ncbi:hypothetical protein SCHIN_v1c10700 [Spiroplasma chinense]|uniref:Uncharacterized protein n=1 Tax=Spiroplasma chinense TaxID=216932 RepID=A0A5B9Y634_9MOLU|nr:hypothetical protein SCHIN_v1c10700 [Spiroplasma chinense]